MKNFRSQMAFRDLLVEALTGILSKPGRMALTIGGIVIGLTALVATIGLTNTAANSIISNFDELAATEITVTAKSSLVVEPDPETIPWDSSQKISELRGVVAAGTLSEVDLDGALISSSPMIDPRGQTSFSMTVKAASPELFKAVRATVSSGQHFNGLHSRFSHRVALIGIHAAESLGIHSLSQLPAIAIGDYVYMVMGIISEVERKHELLSGVVIPEGTAQQDFLLKGPESIVVETQIGAASLIAKQIPFVIRPDNTNTLKIDYPIEPQRVRDAVQSDLNSTLLLLGGLSLIVGAIGIANITLVSVMERIGEIGLRRALGASSAHIALQFLLESALLGLIGGVLGDCLGVMVVVAVSTAQQWTPVLDPLIPLITPLLGMVIGIISGGYPAFRASKMEPVEALRY